MGQAWGCGKYTDFAQADLRQAEQQEIWERRPLDCIAPPNLSPWALAALQQTVSTASEQQTGKHSVIWHCLKHCTGRS